MQDRYGNRLSTQSTDAMAAYVEGIDLLLSAQPGGIDMLQCAVDLDEHFVVARADLARALQIVVRTGDARREIAAAQNTVAQHRNDFTEQEIAHVQIVGELIGGRVPAAFKQIKQHIETYPRDVMLVQPCCGVFGIIGFSGRDQREAENLEFMQRLAPAYGQDWWFSSQLAFALCEVGELNQADDLLLQAYDANPNNANAVHHRAHIHYELGEKDAGLRALEAWRAHYDRRGILFGHLAWHATLWALADAGEEGNLDRVWEIMDADLHPATATAPPLNVLTDYIALLLRCELAGSPRPQARWQLIADYARDCFPKPGLSFADFHAATAHALVGGSELAVYRRPEGIKGAAGDQVVMIANAMAAFAQQDWLAAMTCMTPVMSSHERLGGSRAQRDLLELIYTYTKVRAVRGDDARATCLARRACLREFLR